VQVVANGYNSRLDIGRVEQEMFGSNFMFNFHLVEDTDARDANFEAGTDLLGVHGLRYPGGGVSEKYFDITTPDERPDNFKDGYSFVGLTDFLDWCEETGQPAAIVIPTSPVLENGAVGTRGIKETAVEDVKQFVHDVLTGKYGDVSNISGFELGNEYWALMTATEYGRVANALEKVITETFDELDLGRNERPDLLVQMGSPWGSEYGSGGPSSGLSWGEKVQKSNQDIIEQIKNPDGFTGLIEHFYFSGTDDVFTNRSHELDYINYDVDIWRDNGFDQPIFISEWNVEQSNSSQLGLKGAGVILEMFSDMVSLGVVSANVWLQQSSNITALAGGYRGDPELTPSGAVFKLLAENTVGARVFDAGVTGKVEVDGYRTDKTLTYFLSSRSDKKVSVEWQEPDTSDLITMTKVVQIGADLSTSDGIHTVGSKDYAVKYFNEHDVVADIEDIAPVASDQTLKLDLDPFEVVMISYDLTNASASTNSADGSASETPVVNDGGGSKLVGGEEADRIVGTRFADEIIGSGGDDLLIGRRGHDTLRGGTGNDTLKGGVGRDQLGGWDGDDILMPHLGHGELRGGDGRDTVSFHDVKRGLKFNISDDEIKFGFGRKEFTLDMSEVEVFQGTRKRDRINVEDSGLEVHGGRGRDVLVGGDSDDHLDGGAGRDVIKAGSGSNIVSGGRGSDTFVFEFSKKGFSTEIRDFEAGVDRMKFVGMDIEDFSASSVGDGASLHFDWDEDGKDDFVIHLPGVDYMELAI